MSQKYSIMSYNFRINNSGDGKYSLYPDRIEYALDFLEKNGTDIICFQEIQPDTRQILCERLSPKYAVVGLGRGADFREEACCIAYRTDKFDLFSCDTFWLSPTPGKPNSTPVGIKMPRICTTATLVATVPDEFPVPIRVYNTHLFRSKDERLRTYGAYLVLDRIRRDKDLADYPVILAGDFNSAPDSLAIEAVKSYPTLSLVDATAPLDYTYHEYEREDLAPEKKVRIDYIFTDAKIVESSPQKIAARRESDGMFLSDHYPVKVEIEL